MMLVICDACGNQALGHWWPFKVEGNRRTFIMGACCEDKPFRVPEPLSATVTVRRPDGKLTVYEVA